jgi:hypothetical protein
MTFRKLSLAAAALLLPPASLLGWYAGWFSPAPPDPWEFLKSAGYSELAPPSRLFAPGTITTVETIGKGKVRLHLACRMDNDALQPLFKVSDTVAAQFGSRVSEAFSAESKAFGIAAAKATGNRVKQISIALSNMQIVTIPHDDMIRIRNDHLKGPCEEAVIWNLKQNASVCQVEEVLKADVTYRMSFADTLKTNERAELTKEVNASLDLGADFTGVGEMRGEDLYFGVRVNLRCFQLAGARRLIG